MNPWKKVFPHLYVFRDNVLNILIVTDSYPPEIRSASHLMQDLAEELSDRGHKVFVATCYPQYNLTESGRSQPFKEYSVEAGISVLRIQTLPHHKVNFIIRGVSQLSLPFIFWRKIRLHIKESIDAILVYSPPLPLWKVGQKLKKQASARFILNIQDIFPQNAIDLGALRHSLLINFFERMEKTAYQAADVVTVHSQGNADFLLENKKITANKLQILHNWIDIDGLEEKVHGGPFRRKLGLDGKFIFFFGGVMGPSQGLDKVVEAAGKVKDLEDMVILLVGDGSEKTRLVDDVERHGLENVLFHPFISKEEYQTVLKEMDVGLVSLTAKNRTPVVPGKILGYMAAGIPVLAFLNKESDGHQIIREADCGASTVSDDVNRMAELMRGMYQKRAKLDKLGRNGYQYAAAHFSRKTCVDKIERLLN